MILWNSFAKFDRTRSFGAWARGIAARKILESHRLRARLPETVPPEVIEAVAAAFDADVRPTVWQKRETALTQCIDLLPERSGALISERYTKGRTVEEIADSTGMTSDAIYQALSRLRKQLRECVERRMNQMNTFF